MGVTGGGRGFHLAAAHHRAALHGSPGSPTPAMLTYAGLLYHFAAHLQFGRSISPEVSAPLEKISDRGLGI